MKKERCRAATKKTCNKLVSPSAPNDGLCCVHWRRKYGHVWKYQGHVKTGSYREMPTRKCLKCDAVDTYHDDRWQGGSAGYEKAFDRCPSPENPNLELTGERIINAASGVEVSRLTNEALQWKTRALVAEAMLSKLFSEDVISIASKQINNLTETVTLKSKPHEPRI